MRRQRRRRCSAVMEVSFATTVAMGKTESGVITNKDCHEEQQPNLRVLEGVQQLSTIEAALRFVHAISGQVLEEHSLFCVGQEFCCRWRFRKEQKRNNAQKYRDAPQHHKHHSPALQARVCRVLEPKRQNSTNDLSGTQTAIPESVSRCLFGLIIPPTNDEHQTRHSASFEYAYTHSTCEQGRVVLDGCGTRGRYSP